MPQVQEPHGSDTELFTQYVVLEYLPGCETGRTHEVTAGFNLNIFVILCTDLTQLEGGAHFTVELILLLFKQKHFC